MSVIKISWFTRLVEIDYSIFACLLSCWFFLDRLLPYGKPQKCTFFMAVLYHFYNAPQIFHFSNSRCLLSKLLKVSNFEVLTKNWEITKMRRNCTFQSKVHGKISKKQKLLHTLYSDDVLLVTEKFQADENTIIWITLNRQTETIKKSDLFSIAK